MKQVQGFHKNPGKILFRYFKLIQYLISAKYIFVPHKINVMIFSLKYYIDFPCLLLCIVHYNLIVLYVFHNVKNGHEP